jgi:pyruvate dehydrogenase E2 component (dihydrolipoamide acetyltransferase)
VVKEVLIQLGDKVSRRRGADQGRKAARRCRRALPAPAAPGRCPGAPAPAPAAAPAAAGGGVVEVKVPDIGDFDATCR